MCFICELMMDPTGEVREKAREKAREELKARQEYAEIALRTETEEKLRMLLEPVVANVTGFECSCNGLERGYEDDHCEGVMTHLLAALVPDVSALAAAYGELMAMSGQLALSVLSEANDKGTDSKGSDDE